MSIYKISSFFLSLLVLFSVGLSASPIGVGWLDEGTPNERVVIPFEIPAEADALSVSLAIEKSFNEYLDLTSEGSIYSADFSEIFSEAISPPNLSVLGLYLFEANIPYSRPNVEDHRRTLKSIVRVDVRDRENPKLVVNPIFWQSRTANYVAWGRFYDKKSGDVEYYAKPEYLAARKTAEKTAVGLAELIQSYLGFIPPRKK